MAGIKSVARSLHTPGPGRSSSASPSNLFSELYLSKANLAVCNSKESNEEMISGHNSSPGLNAKERRGSRFKKKSKSVSVLTSSFMTDSDHDEVYGKSTPKESLSRSKFCHSIYHKAAALFEMLTEQRNFPDPAREGIVSLVFEDDLQKRRCYSLAFAAKRYEAVLKDVLLDSAFYSSYYKLEVAHHAKVLVMLIDFYEHNFCFSESDRKKLLEDFSLKLPHILEIQNALASHKVKLCAAFARSRIQACALSIEGLLPLEVKLRGECGAKHPLYLRINTLLTSRADVLTCLEQEGFIMALDQSPINLVNGTFASDEHFIDLLVFSRACKDEVYNSGKTLKFELVPQSKPRFILVEVVRSALEDLAVNAKPAMKTIPGSSPDLLNEESDILITHAELGSLAAHLSVYMHQYKRLVICSVGNKGDEIRKRLRQMGATTFDLVPDMFLTISPDDERVKRCKVIVCNPPCSKSGVVNPVDFILQEGVEAASLLSGSVSDAQLKRLVSEQRDTLMHCFNFPQARYIVYATVSLHGNENENLLKDVLGNQSEGTFQGAPYQLRSFLPDLTQALRRMILTDKTDGGLSSQDEPYLLLPPSSYMDGFFIALLSRQVTRDCLPEHFDRATTPKSLTKKSVRRKDGADGRSSREGRSRRLSPERVRKHVDHPDFDLKALPAVTLHSVPSGKRASTVKKRLLRAHSSV